MFEQGILEGRVNIWSHLDPSTGGHRSPIEVGLIRDEAKGSSITSDLQQQRKRRDETTEETEEKNV